MAVERVRAAGDDLLFFLHFDDARGVGVGFVDPEDENQRSQYDDLRGDGNPGGDVRPAEAPVKARQEEGRQIEERGEGDDDALFGTRFSVARAESRDK